MATGGVATLDILINVAYIVAAILFVFGLKMLSAPASARRGNVVSAVGMFVAIVATLFDQGIVTWQWIIAGTIIGSAIGAVTAKRIQMTQMPEMVGLFNGAGGLASLLVGWAALYATGNTTFTAFTIVLSVLIGGVTFTGSVVAWAKLSERMPTRAIVFGAQRFVNALLLAGVLVAGAWVTLAPDPGSPAFFVLLALSLVLGVMAVIPIGGADMPVVISLLNSYSGIAACAAGFAIANNVLIVSGALVGAAGLILTNVMCKAMNRSLTNVLFSGFGAVQTGTAVQGEVRPITVDDAHLILDAAASVTFVPGYGMAVAQAQHVVRELGERLAKNGCDVTFAVHPVAGRMPGHMNVLLAEANVPYEQMVEMETINARMDNVDVAVVIGANDVVNPAALEDPKSPIAGMPIIEVHRARTVFVLKRSMASGFSGIDNPLFFRENTRMLFGDAKSTISALEATFKA